MQPVLKASARPGSRASRLPNSQRARTFIRSCLPTYDACVARDKTALTIASIITTTFVAAVSAAPVFAEEAVAEAFPEASVENTHVSMLAVDHEVVAAAGVQGSAEQMVAPALQDPAPVLSEASVIAEAEVAPAVIPVVEVTPALIPVVEVAPAVIPVAEVVSEEIANPVPIGAVANPEEPAFAPVAFLDPVFDTAPTIGLEEMKAAAAAPEAVVQEVIQPLEKVLAVEPAPAATITAIDEAARVNLPQLEVEAVAPATVEEAPVAMNSAAATESVVEGTAVAAPEPVVADAVYPAAVVEAEETLVVEVPPSGDVEVVAPTLAVEEPTVEAVVSALEAVPEPVVVPVEAAVPVPAPVAAEAAPSPAAGGLDLQALFARAIAAVAPAGWEGPSAETLTYVALGTAAASFVATFFVASRFKEAFKEPVDWKDMYSALAARGVKTVTAEEAYAKAKKGAVILDVRLADSYSRRSTSPSVNVPIYQPIAGWDAASNIRRLGFAFFGIFGTELKEDFVAEVAAKVPKNKEVIVMCETGGTIENKPGTQFGFQSRSLKALYYLQQAGYGKVLHMKSGLSGWQRAGLPLSDEAGETAAAKPGAATGRGTRGGSTSVTSASSRIPRGTSSGNSKARTTSKELLSATTRDRK